MQTPYLQMPPYENPLIRAMGAVATWDAAHLDNKYG